MCVNNIMISSFDEDLARLRDDALPQNVRCSMIKFQNQLVGVWDHGWYFTFNCNFVRLDVYASIEPVQERLTDVLRTEPHKATMKKNSILLLAKI